MADFADHFSRGAARYAAFRPHYPPALFAWLAARAPARRLAWDCGTGSGQAAVALAEHFERVVATDASAEQLRNAAPHPRVSYRVAPADASGLDAGTADLVTAAQAAHWFPSGAFHQEVRRVAAPHALVALWCYGLLTIDAGVDPLISRFYHETVGPWWPPERRLVDDAYRSLEFPWDEIEAPRFEMEALLDRDGLAGYLRTWSATQRCAAERGIDPVAELVEALATVWPDREERRAVRWPLHLRAGFVSRR